jgi:small subunit ribosomal protein S16
VSVKIRLKRFGRRNRASYRINAIDSRTARDGRVIEELGFYDPVSKDPEKQFKLNKERVEYWLSVGAQPSDTVRTLLVKAGVALKKAGK